MIDHAIAVPEGKYVDIGGGLHMHYHEAGRGTPLLFLHGSGPGASGWSNFKKNFPYFAERGHRVIVIDNLGFGHSSKPDDRDYSMDFVVGGVIALLDRLGIERCAVIGNSHGGAVAIQLALLQPQRVSKLVLMAPGGLEEREVYMKMAGIRTMMKVFLGPDGITREGMKQVFELQLYDPSQLDEQTLDERIEIAHLQPKRVMTSLGVPHLSPQLANLTCPVLGWWGANDQFCPPSGATTLAQMVPDARVQLLSRCGHWVMVEYPDLFNRQTLDFLAPWSQAAMHTPVSTPSAQSRSQS
jgi:4,5:9,10-diseco-3-hydroxy-5,9,17-trioxoandrosta-1(10),2-diene-4-oate hydrolase